jgi:GNAT superfamily N-acetyltransferase
MVKQASEKDIPIIEGILLDAARWMDDNGIHMWDEQNVLWDNLSKHNSIDNFYIACDSDTPASCMSLTDYDPVFWPDIPKGESLYIHKLAVLRKYAGQGYTTELIDYAKEKARQSGIKAIRLDCHKGRPKLRAVYERHGFVCVDEKTLFGK